MSTKENLKANEAGARTLFVGVGGTGSKIVVRVAEMCRPGEAENISFACMDTDVNDLKVVAKSGAHIYRIQTSSTQSVGNYLNYDADALNNWFPKNKVMFSKSVSEGAGQVRAISRLALNATIKNGNIRELYNAIDALYRKDGGEMKQALRVVMVSTTSGGTGSGMILPLSMLIRSYVTGKYPNSAVIIRAMMLLPETLDSVITSTAERESQRRNAYATIKEINAFMMQGTGIFDADETLSRYKGLHVDIPTANSGDLQSLALLPFDFCFLMDGQDANDDTMIDLAQYREQAAQALYQQNIGPMQAKAFSMEDNIIKEFASAGNYARNRFGGIGSSIVRYPYARVAKYISYGWALDAISGEGSSSWYRYDRKFKIKLAEARKKHIPRSDPSYPKMAEFYVSQIKDAGDDKFSKDLVGTYELDGAEDRIESFLADLTDTVYERVSSNTTIDSAMRGAKKLGSTIEYGEEENCGEAVDNLGRLRTYERAVKFNASATAQTAAEGILYNETATSAEKKSYTVESLMKVAGKILHPNAMRYMLYRLKTEVVSRRGDADDQRKKDMKTLGAFAIDADEPGKFDVSKTKGEEETTIDMLCAAETGKKAVSKEVHETLNVVFPEFYKNIGKLARHTSDYETMVLLEEYIEELIGEFEKFYESFNEKVSVLQRKREDLITELAFRAGNSVMNVCGTEDVLYELQRETVLTTSDDTLLDSDLCGEIFDAVKANVTFDREHRNDDSVEEDGRKDIFDDVVLGFFERTALTTDNLDMNIVEAVAKEHRLAVRHKNREEAETAGTQGAVVDKLSHAELERYVTAVFGKGYRLAAPSVQRMSFCENREVRLCSYNRTLDDMRDYRIAELVPDLGAIPSETVSRYEMQFFTALYNLTPDKLNKFAAPRDTETGHRDAGLYHAAYMKYGEQIGPDSTKGLTLSTHIDKRWDSLAVMPDLDFEFMKQQMMKIHQAVIYALVYGNIVYTEPANVGDTRKIYYYENADERRTDLIVSNGTPCDEFYEILDAFYNNPSAVGDMMRVCAMYRKESEDHSTSFEQTVFGRNLAEFAIEGSFAHDHDGVCSLFEIPLAYYSSLPSSLRFRDEIADMVDAVVQTLDDEVSSSNKNNRSNAVAILRQVLLQQFELFIKDFRSTYPDQVPADNMVVDLIYRKVRNAVSQNPVPQDLDGVLDGLKKLIR